MTTDTALRHSVLVDVPVTRAFHVFTARFGDWWPKHYKLFDDDLVERTLEPSIGGRIIDRGAAGSTCCWGRVLAFDAPDRLVFSWDISPRWEVETDADRCSEVEVTFVAEGPSCTRVVVEHRHLERHGEQWQALRASLGAEAGWSGVLRSYDQLIGR